jgi:aminopeptidase N
METGEGDIADTCYQQFSRGNNMTDVMAALVSLANNECPQREQALNEFYEKWKNDSLVVDKWLGIQATSRLPGTLERVKALVDHEAFTLKNPNKIRALIGAFGHGNPSQFHDLSGEGYQFFTGKILEIDKMNPQIAARLATVYTMWRKYDEQRQTLMKQQLDSIAAEPGLSKDVYEIASKSLG